MRYAIFAAASLALAGCKDTYVEDNGPDQFEREQAMRICSGEWDPRDAQTHLRMFCTMVIYGGQ